MGAEVTQKDLQSLQGYINKKIAELDKKIADLKAENTKQTALFDSAIEQINKGFASTIQTVNDNAKVANANTKALAELRAIVDQHAKVINAR